MSSSANVSAFSKVCEVSHSELPGFKVILDAVPQRFRFLDGNAFLDEDVLRIVDIGDTHLSDVRYAAVSYPWRDLQMPPNEAPSEGSFGVDGAQHADPISIDVLRTVCLAARIYQVSLVWIDRLCIIQDNKDDKNWQIQRMFEVYASCEVCLVVPGGLVRLAGLAETTSWADRAWTLQEAVAPSEKKELNCVFSFTHESYKDFLEEQCELMGLNAKFAEFLRKSNHNPLQHIVEPAKSAMCALSKLFHLMWGCTGAFKYHQPNLQEQEYHTRFPVRIVHTPSARLLQRAMDLRGMHLWRAAYARSSSRSVDMIFSIMGLFNVSLSVAHFGPSDRTKATIKLLQKLMANRRPATWLYIAPEMAPSPELSTLPVMPETSESGCAYVHSKEGVLMASDAIQSKELWRTEGAPVGRVDDSGYFTFWARGAPVLRDFDAVHSPTCKTTGHHRSSTDKAHDDRQVWAIIIGRRRELNRDPVTGQIRGTPRGQPIPVGFEELTLMFVENHAHELYHRIGMEREVELSKTNGWKWTWREFRVGGPGRGERIRFGTSPSGPVRMDRIDVEAHLEKEMMRFYDGKSDRHLVHD